MQHEVDICGRFTERVPEKVSLALFDGTLLFLVLQASLPHTRVKRLKKEIEERYASLTFNSSSGIQSHIHPSHRTLTHKEKWSDSVQKEEDSEVI